MKGTNRTPIRRPESPVWHQTNDRGTALVEYVLLVALIAIGSVVTIGTVGSALNDTLEVTAASLEAPSTDDEESGDDSDSVDEVTTTTIAAGSGGGPGSDADDDGSEEGSSDDGSGSSTPTTTVPSTAGDSGSSDIGGSAGSDSGSGDSDDAGDGGADADDDPGVTATETVGVAGELSITFAAIDGAIVISDLDPNGWEYTITKNQKNRVHVEFQKPGSNRSATVKGWLTGSGDLKASVKEKNKKK